MPSVVQHTSRSGVRIYTLPVEVFPRFWANVYLLVGDGIATLVDSGSGLGASDEHLLEGFAQVREQWGEAITPADLRRIIITHAHIDHFGGLKTLRQHTAAPITMHPIDRRVLTNYEGRLVMASRQVSLFLRRSGVDEAERQRLMEMYTWSKNVFHSLPVEELVEDGDRIDGLLDVIHAPGHCPGQICLRMGEVLLSADHILARTSPHMAPESITPGTGLEHYRRALRTVGRLEGIELTLAGHEDPITDLPGRVDALYASHDRKLNRILDLLREQPRTVAELSAAMYRNLDGYDVLLGLEEVGAHVEFLYLRGHIRPANLDPADEAVATPLVYEVF